MSEYTEEQLAAWREARRLFPGLLSTISDQESLIESHAELSARVAELEERHTYLEGTTILTKCKSCGSECTNRLDDMMGMADSMRVATRPDQSEGSG